jgi:hypothetical protein
VSHKIKLPLKAVEIINACAPLRQGENGVFFFIADKLYHTDRLLSIGFQKYFFIFPIFLLLPSEIRFFAFDLREKLDNTAIVMV